MIIFRYLTTWSLLQKPLHILTSPVALWSSHSELCERVCPALKSSVLSAWIKRKSQLLGFELFFIWVEENEFSSVQSLSHVQLFVTLWTAARQASLSFTISQRLLKFMSLESVMPSNHLSFPSPPTFNLSQHQGLFKWVSSLHQVAKVLEFQFQHQSFPLIFRTDFL